MLDKVTWQSFIGYLASVRRRTWIALMVMLLALAAVEFSTHNRCGNEQRNWQTLTYPKVNYCSVPSWVPVNPWYENANKAICKVHDNNSGIYGTISQREADFRFLCDYVKRSKMPWGIRHVSGLLSYVALRVVAIVG